MCVGYALEISCSVRRCHDDSLVLTSILSPESRPVAVGHEKTPIRFSSRVLLTEYVNRRQSLHASIVRI